MKPVAAKLSLVAILALFVFPLIFAWVTYSGLIDWQPEDTENLGQLVIPPVPLDWNRTELVGQPESNGLHGHWVVLLPLQIPCQADCLIRVTQVRQVHRALGRHQDRVRIALLGEQTIPAEEMNTLHEIYRQFNLLEGPDVLFTEALQQVAEQQGALRGATLFYLVDPLGNIMMTYDGQDGPSKLSKDLKKLMAWSKLDTR
ncbi:MAG TPA: hypothetical protein VKN35_08540 [Xanthomonadales bacterium]|nr:hypothetical protein [Xanthomonadales bacterium]